MSAGERLPGTPVPMHKWAGAGGVMIAGDTWGDPKGPLVALMHGGGQTRHAWKGAARPWELPGIMRSPLTRAGMAILIGRRQKIMTLISW